jgi:hypothetical protein
MTKKSATVGDLQRMVANPIYAGIGPYPAILPEATWLDAANRSAREVGHRPYLDTLREEFQKALQTTGQALPDWLAAETWLDEAERQFEAQPQTYLKDLLKRLRADLGGQALR